MKNNSVKKKAILAVVVVEFLALMLFFVDKTERDSFKGTINRPPPGEEKVVEALDVTIGDSREEIRVEVSPKARSEKEKQELFAGAKKEIEETFFGENPDADHVYSNLFPKTSYQSGVVEASWEFSDSNIVEISGNLVLDNITDPALIEAKATLTCEDDSEIYDFFFKVLPPTMDTKTGKEYFLEKSLSKADKTNPDGEAVTLPEVIGDMDARWSLKDNQRAIQLAIFGIAIGIVIVFAGREEDKRQRKIRIKRLESDYPEIVSMLSLYVGAGISLKGAFTRIAQSHGNLDGEKHPGFEAVAMLKRDMDDGKGELEAYKDFGRRTGHRDYRKLSILLTQNLRKGSDQLTGMLEKEEYEAFEERKIRAKIAGEEASTKLLIPMMGLLMIVMAVLIFPAMQGMDF